MILPFHDSFYMDVNSYGIVEALECLHQCLINLEIPTCCMFSYDCSTMEV